MAYRILAAAFVAAIAAATPASAETYEQATARTMQGRTAAPWPEQAGWATPPGFGRSPAPGEYYRLCMQNTQGASEAACIASEGKRR